MTEKSLELHKKVVLVFDEIEDNLLKGFTLDERDQLMNFLSRLEKNLEQEGEK